MCRTPALLALLVLSVPYPGIANANQIISVPFYHLRSAAVQVTIGPASLRFEGDYTFEMTTPGQVLPTSYALGAADSTMGEVAGFEAFRSANGGPLERLFCKAKPSVWRCRVDARGAATLRVTMRYQRALHREEAHFMLIPEVPGEDLVDSLALVVETSGLPREPRFALPFPAGARSGLTHAGAPADSLTPAPSQALASPGEPGGPEAPPASTATRTYWRANGVIPTKPLEIRWGPR